MGVRKIKILLEDYISREPNNSYGTISISAFTVNVFITQDMKDLGMFLDYPSIEYNKDLVPLTYEPLPTKLLSFGGSYNFLVNQGANFHPIGSQSDVRYRYKSIGSYHTNGIIVTGFTEDRLDSVSSYGFSGVDKFVPGFDLNKDNYINYLGNNVNGVTRVLSINDYSPLIYTEDAKVNDVNIGTLLQSDGILFKTYSGQTRTVTSQLFGTYSIPITKMSFQGQGINKTNSSLSALTIQEYLLHITERPKVESDLFIDRGFASALQNHLQLGEIVTLDQLVNYGNGYYNII